MSLALASESRPEGFIVVKNFLIQHQLFQYTTFAQNEHLREGKDFTHTHPCMTRSCQTLSHLFKYVRRTSPTPGALRSRCEIRQIVIPPPHAQGLLQVFLNRYEADAVCSCFHVIQIDSKFHQGTRNAIVSRCGSSRCRLRRWYT